MNIVRTNGGSSWNAGQTRRKHLKPGEVFIAKVRRVNQGLDEEKEIMYLRVTDVFKEKNSELVHARAEASFKERLKQRQTAAHQTRPFFTMRPDRIFIPREDAITA